HLLQADVDLTVPLLLGQLVGAADHRRVRVVVDEVEAAEPRDGLVGEALPVGERGDVAAPVETARAERARDLLALRVLDVRDDDDRPFRAELPCGCRADPARTPGDDGYLDFESRRHLSWPTSDH